MRHTGRKSFTEPRKPSETPVARERLSLYIDKVIIVTIDVKSQPH